MTVDFPPLCKSTGTVSERLHAGSSPSKPLQQSHAGILSQTEAFLQTVLTSSSPARTITRAKRSFPRLCFWPATAQPLRKELLTPTTMLPFAVSRVTHPSPSSPVGRVGPGERIYSTHPPSLVLGEPTGTARNCSDTHANALRAQCPHLLLFLFSTFFPTLGSPEFYSWCC